MTTDSYPVVTSRQLLESFAHYIALLLDAIVLNILNDQCDCILLTKASFHGLRGRYCHGYNATTE